MPPPSSDDSVFARRLAEAARSVEDTLTVILAEPPNRAEFHHPPRLLAAMRHSVLSGGKRFRPFLVMECAGLFGVSPSDSVRSAAAVECLHCYSLVHDDLPAMDDDDFRRGVPTVHKAFDDATAILAGDALQSLAFDILSRAATHAAGDVRVELVQILARAAGIFGMAGGQMLDIEAETTKPDEAGIRRLQAMKTGALIAASCEMGAVLGDASPEARSALKEYGQALGLAFQIADDLLDVEAAPEALGKASGKDRARGKATFVSLLGRDGARRLLGEAVEACQIHLTPFGAKGGSLVAAARFAAERNR